MAHGSAATARSEDIAREILKESLLHRADGARIAVVGMLVSIVPFFLVLRAQVPLENLALWILPMPVFVLVRAGIAARTRRELPLGDEQALRRLDRHFRANSIGLQFWLGTGMWSVAGRGTEVDLIVTVAVCIFGTGAAISLSHDARAVALSIPLLFGQCIAFWMLRGADGYHIFVPLIVVMALIIASSRASERSLNETIAIRFENDALLRQLEREKEAAVAAAREAVEANRSKSLFMAAASHDLRQPLYAITLLAETLELQRLAEPAGAIVNQQLRALSALRSMFDNLLDLSRFDGGDVRPKVEPVYLPDLLADLLAEFQPQCESAGLGFEVQLLEEFVLSDFELLSRLLRNLLSNSVRYTDAGWIHLEAEIEGDCISISVVDSGCGIGPEDQKRVFEEFVQLTNPQRNRDHGVGLGLSIVQRIGRLLDHEIELVSDRDRGTRVTIRLERAASAGIRSQTPARVPSRVELADRPPLLWIVEDDELVRDALQTHLGVLAIRPHFGACRSDLEQLAERFGWPDQVLLDDMLSREETGLEIAQWLSEKVPSDRILLMTGNTDPDRLRTLDESGFAVVRKPVSANELAAWLHAPAQASGRGGNA